MVAKPKILIIDDDPTLQEMYRARFRKAKFEVLQAANGDQGIIMAFETKPDVILLDLMMPIKGGLGVLDVLKSMPATRDTPIVILTAYPSDEYHQKGTRSGAALFLSKSEVMPGDVVAKIQALLEQKSQ